MTMDKTITFPVKLHDNERTSRWLDRFERLRKGPDTCEKCQCEYVSVLAHHDAGVYMAVCLNAVMSNGRHCEAKAFEV